MLRFRKRHCKSCPTKYIPGVKGASLFIGSGPDHSVFVCLCTPQWNLGSPSGILLHLKFVKCIICILKIKATSLLLMLLLVTVQQLSANCDVRCATMAARSSASGSSASRVSGMAHCHGMSAQPVFGSEHGLTQYQACVSHTCTSDWVFVQTAHDLNTSPLRIGDLRYEPISISVAASMHFDAAQKSPHAIPLLGPLLISASLRV